VGINYSRRARITADALRAEFFYNPETGIFTTKASRKGRIVGRPCLFANREGYVMVPLWGRAYAAHRLAWVYMTGSWPETELDHINGVRDDNRWSNLRASTRQENMQNRHNPNRNSAVGLIGVDIVGSGHYRARIRVGGKNVSLGCYKTKEEAYSAYLSAKRKYHPSSTLANG
jgi:hypothetical protein